MPLTDLETNRDFQRRWQRAQRVKRRTKAIALLGGKCVDCGNPDHRVLQLDHIVPVLRDRSALSEAKQTTGVNLVRSILAGRVDPNTIALRCANCHQIKTYADRTGFSNYIEGTAGYLVE